MQQMSSEQQSVTIPLPANLISNLKALRNNQNPQPSNNFQNQQQNPPKQQSNFQHNFQNQPGPKKGQDQPGNNQQAFQKNNKPNRGGDQQGQRSHSQNPRNMNSNPQSSQASNMHTNPTQGGQNSQQTVTLDVNPSSLSMLNQLLGQMQKGQFPNLSITPTPTQGGMNQQVQVKNEDQQQQQPGFRYSTLGNDQQGDQKSFRKNNFKGLKDRQNNGGGNFNDRSAGSKPYNPFEVNTSPSNNPFTTPNPMGGNQMGNPGQNRRPNNFGQGPRGDKPFQGKGGFKNRHFENNDRSRSRTREKSGPRNFNAGMPYDPEHENMNPNRNRVPKPQTSRKGDWTCPNCQNVNFAKRDQCNRCQTEKPPGLEMPEAEGEKKPGLEFKKGDWMCVTCKNLNFAKRESCNRCQSARPAETYTDYRPSKKSNFKREFASKQGMNQNFNQNNNNNMNMGMNNMNPGNMSLFMGNVNDDDYEPGLIGNLDR